MHRKSSGRAQLVKGRESLDMGYTIAGGGKNKKEMEAPS
jgi:hypothetical protein